MSLRTVALVASLSLPGCGGDGLSELETMQKQQGDAASQIKALGGEATMKQYALGEAWAVSLPGVTVDEDTVAALAGLGRIAELDLSRATVTDEQFIQIVDGAGFLTKVDVSNTALTDKSMERLATVGVLTELNLAGTKISPEGISQFKSKRAADTRIRPMFKSPKIKT